MGLDGGPFPARPPASGKPDPPPPPPPGEAAAPAQGAFMIVGQMWRYSPRMTHDHGGRPFGGRKRGRFSPWPGPYGAREPVLDPEVEPDPAFEAPRAPDLERVQAPSPVPPYPVPDDAARDRAGFAWPSASPGPGLGTGCADAESLPRTAGLPPGPPPGTWTIRIGTNPITNKVINAHAATAGSRLPTGCSRTTAAVFLSFVRIQSAHSATVSCGVGNAGPQPRLASCRSLRSTALRCLPVSPGSRKTVTPRARCSTLPCNPGARSL